MPDHPRWTTQLDPTDLEALFDAVLAGRQRLADDARLRGDPDAERFWRGVAAIVEAMRQGLAAHPRSAPEVAAFLTRATRRQGTR